MSEVPGRSAAPENPECADAPAFGLAAWQVAESRRLHGANLLTPPPRDPWWALLLEKFDDPIIRILLVAAVVAVIMGLFNGHYEEGIGIIAAIALTTIIAFAGEYKAGREFDVLNQASDDAPVRVVRDGRHQAVPRRDVVVGDRMLMEQGDEIAADADVVEAVSFQVNESALTGESEPATKKPASVLAGESAQADGAYPRHRVLRGSLVIGGHAAVRVVAVGDRTEIGRAARAAAETSVAATPLQKQLSRLARVIGVFGFGAAAAIFTVLVVRGALTGELGAGLDGLLSGNGRLLEYFMIAVAVIVVSMPEGLPMSVTLSLAYSMRKMTATNNLVRRLHATETIGAATVICSDKTGTLTRNEMRVAALRVPWLPEQSPEKAGDAWRRWIVAVAANTTADLGFDARGQVENLLGNPTEAALLLWLYERGADAASARRGFCIARQLPFSTERKFMVTIGFPNAGDFPEYEGKNGEPRAAADLYAKGAPEILLGRCDRLRMAGGGERPLADADRAAALAEVRGFQERGMRVLGFADRRVEARDADAEPGELARGMVWAGFAAIADPVRPEAPPAIAACRAAGVRVKVVTGDNEITAREIARQIGLWEPEDGDDRHIGGDAFAALDDAAASEAAVRIKLMSRARPLDKLRLVTLLREQNEVVAVTGDGANDAPALNHADVGLAMGRAGTSVAKEAADIILLDDSFASIVNAVMWGRSLYANIQKFILFQLTINVAALGIALLGPFLGVALPLTVMQMLWVNLIMDSLAALAFATEPPDPEALRRPPRPPDAFIVTPAMTRIILGTALAFLGLFLVAAVGLRREFPLAADSVEGLRNLSLFFGAFVFLQFWNMFNARGLGSNRSAFFGLGRSRGFLLVMLAIAAGQVLITQFGGRAFRTVPLGAADWCWIILGTSPVLGIGEAFRAWRRWRARPVSGCS